MEFPGSYRALPDKISAFDSEGLYRLNRDMQTVLRDIIDIMGERSAKAQKLPAIITSFSKLANSYHAQRLYIHHQGDVVNGILKVGVKNLFVTDYRGRTHEIAPLCVLDFYVHESCQRYGIGKELFDHMRQRESVEAHKMGYDRPSPKLIGFLKKHFGLRNFQPQVNNYVVFDKYFQPKPKPVQVSGSSVTTPPQSPGYDPGPSPSDPRHIPFNSPFAPAAGRPFSKRHSEPEAAAAATVTVSSSASVYMDPITGRAREFTHASRLANDPVQQDPPSSSHAELQTSVQQSLPVEDQARHNPQILGNEPLGPSSPIHEHGLGVSTASYTSTGALSRRPAEVVASSDPGEGRVTHGHDRGPVSVGQASIRHGRSRARQSDDVRSMVTLPSGCGQSESLLPSIRSFVHEQPYSGTGVAGAASFAELKRLSVSMEDAEKRASDIRRRRERQDHDQSTHTKNQASKAEYRQLTRSELFALQGGSKIGGATVCTPGAAHQFLRVDGKPL